MIFISCDSYMKLYGEGGYLIGISGTFFLQWKQCCIAYYIDTTSFTIVSYYGLCHKFGSGAMAFLLFLYVHIISIISLNSASAELQIIIRNCAAPDQEQHVDVTSNNAQTNLTLCPIAVSRSPKLARR